MISKRLRTPPGPELRMRKQYTVSDGKVVLTLEPAEEGGYVVTSPLDPELITEAETVEEAFANRAATLARAALHKKAGSQSWAATGDETTRVCV